VALYIVVGNSGVFSFGHVAFMSIGAYAGSLLAISPANKLSTQPAMAQLLVKLHLPPFPSCLVGGVVAAVVALLVSVPLIKLSGLTASLTSLAVLVIVYVVFANWTSVTNGEEGLQSIPTPAGVTDLWLVSVAVIGSALLFQHSRWGRRLRASREDEIAARSLGLSINRERRIAFVVSAFFMGVAGALYAELLGALVPETLYISTTTLILIMLIVGGTTSLSGAVTGCVVISTLSEVLVKIQDGVRVAGISVHGPIGIQQVGLAVVMLTVILLFPRGLTHSRELTWLSGPLSGTWRWLSSHLAGQLPPPGATEAGAEPGDH
jgi:branched-chain amino acid transport system permease protein